MIDFILYGTAFVILDTIGFTIKCVRNERFVNYHLRYFPLIWIWFS